MSIAEHPAPRLVTPAKPTGASLKAAATTKRVAQPFTLKHFRAWASELILDTGASWHLEDFQEAFAEDLFTGIPEVWLVVPEGNGKTTLLSGLALYHCEFRPFAVVPVAAAAREQAEILYRQAEGFVLRSPYLNESVFSSIQAAKGKRKTNMPRFQCLEGYRRINHSAGGRIQVFAADDRTGDGVMPTLAIIDEPHRQKNLSLYRTWSGKLAKRQGQLATISTAGEPGSDFEVTRARIREEGERERTGSFLRVVSKRVILHEWALPPEGDPDDLEQVKAANPFSGITVDLLSDKLNSPTMTPNHWLRYVCNRPALDFDNWLGANAEAIWAALEDPYEFVDGAPTFLGIDVGIKRDSSAVARWQERPDGRWHVKCRLWLPTPDEPVDATEIMQHVRELDATYDVRAASYDPRFFDVPAKMLFDDGIVMVEIPQSVERMTTVIGDFYAAIMGGLVSHDGDEAFTRQMMNPKARYNDRGFTLEKGRSRGRIDGCVAASLGYDRVNRQEPEPAADEAFIFLGRR